MGRRARLRARLLIGSAIALAQGAPHGPDGYRNNYPHEDKGSFWAWKLDQWRNDLPPKAPPGGWNIRTSRPTPRHSAPEPILR
jgi:hypothetical protein